MHASTCHPKDLVQQSDSVEEAASHDSALRVAVHVSDDHDGM
jgi:hypothetical protein